MTRLTLPMLASTGQGPPRISRPTDGPLLDSFGRVHSDLRVSVTDRCNLRCTYCMPETVQFQPHSEILSFEEITRFATIVARLGVRTVRLTGGEPLVRRDIAELVRQVVGVPGITEVALTTNGLLLAGLAHPLRAAGLTRLNVSLDTLDAARFQALTRRVGLSRVLAGLEAAAKAGFDAVKVNAVAMRGFIDQDLVPLAQFCRERGFEMRLIESMPIGGGGYDSAAFVPAAEVLARLAAEVAPLTPVPHPDPHAPARVFEYEGGGRVGVIASVSDPFCGTCDRLRLTADGFIKNCLFGRTETLVKFALRSGTDAEVEQLVRACVWAKAAGHGTATTAFAAPNRTMHAIGG